MKTDTQMKLRSLHLLSPILLCLLLIGCAGPAVRPERQLQWPPAPLPAQIGWVSEISDYKSAGIRMGFWRRVVDFIVGESEQQIGRPYGVYVDGRGRLFIVDSAFGVVHVMDAGTNTYMVIGKGEKASAFKNPIAVTGDDAGNVYITDSAGGLVYRYSFQDNTLAPFVHSLERPTGIAFNKRNRLLYVSDSTASRVVVFDLNGNERFHIGSAGMRPGQFNRPTDLFIDDAGMLYVTDPLNSRIELFSADGAFKRAFGRAGDAPGELSKPKGVAVDSNGNIYVADALSDVVNVYDSAGGFRFSFGEGGTDAGMFWLPSGVCIDREDMVYVADTYNRRVQVFRRIHTTAADGKEK
jgi:DNA-binding beta-propeller fold protein YncE